MAENINQSSTLDPESPYYIDPHYKPDENLTMVTILNQTEDNYFTWKTQFLDFLRFKNKTGYINGTITKPEDTSSPLYEPWRQCNARVKCWLMSSVTETYQDYVRYAETAQKAWEDLRMIFVPSVDLKIYELRLRIATTRQDGDSVGRYFGKLRRAWIELDEYDPLPECTCSGGGCICEIKKRCKEAREKERRFAFLMGLDKELSFVRTQIMIMSPPPSLDKACGLVEQAESAMRWTRR